MSSPDFKSKSLIVIIKYFIPYILARKKRGVNWILPVAPLRRRYSFLFSIYFLGVIQYAPNDVAEIAAMIARISMIQDVLGQNRIQYSPTKKRCCCTKKYGSHGEVHNRLHQIT
jgi:hypothetical protein